MIKNALKGSNDKAFNIDYSCSKCREKDAYISFKGMVEAVRKCFEKAGLNYIEYDEKVNETIFYFADNKWQEVKKATINACNYLDFKLEPKVKILKANTYEVDGYVLKSPKKTEILVITQNCECGESRSVSQRWKIVVSSYTETKDGRVLHLRNNLARVLPSGQELPAKLNDLWVKARESCTGVKPLAVEHVSFPIDIVYTWVNDLDKQWIKKKEEHIRDLDLSNGEDIKNKPKSSTDISRYRNRNELLYSLRSVYMYAPFIRKIYIVSDDQVPEWLDTECKKVEVVFHRDIFDEATAYPVFSSRPIELNIPNINGLAEHFIYMNDDFFICSPVNPSDFFMSNGLAKIFFSNRRLDARQVQDYDRATVAAHKNAATAFERKLGYSITSKITHAPYSIRLSACKEMETVFSEEISITKHNRFRSWDDITWSHLAPFFMFYKGYSVSADIKAKYLLVQDQNLEEKLRDYDNSDTLQVVCVNDTDDVLGKGHEGLFINWMNKRFPLSAPWEK